MIHAEFYHMSTGYVAGSIPPRYSEDAKRPIPACGDRSVIILDGRNSLHTHTEIARKECAKRGYIGFAIRSGRSLSDSAIIRPLELT